jgi:cystathionine beta-lyase
MLLEQPNIGYLRQRQGKKWRTYGDDVLPAWVADMDFPPAEPIRRVLRAALDSTDLGYPCDGAAGTLAELFSARCMEHHSWRVDPGRVEVLGDVIQALYIGLDAFTEPDDVSVILTPIYPPFLTAVGECQRPAQLFTLDNGPNGYEIDIGRFIEELDEHARALLFCNPHNPTGRVFSRSELEVLGEVVLERGLIVIADEIHADLVYPGNRHIPFASLSPELEARTVTLSSATKAFNIAGLRCAVAAFGSEDLQRRFLTVPRHARGGPSSLGLAATRAAWEHGDAWLSELLAYLEVNRDLIVEWVDNKLPGVGHVRPEATYLAWLDCRGLAADPYRFFLNHAKVALSDGRDFGPGGDGFVRLNFATSHAILSEILERMSDAMVGENVCGFS